MKSLVRPASTRCLASEIVPIQRRTLVSMDLDIGKGTGTIRAAKDRSRNNYNWYEPARQGTPSSHL